MSVRSTARQLLFQNLMEVMIRLKIFQIYEKNAIFIKNMNRVKYYDAETHVGFQSS
jgi:hypothetical protein